MSRKPVEKFIASVREEGDFLLERLRFQFGAEKGFRPQDWPDFPFDPLLAEIRRSLADHLTAVREAETNPDKALPVRLPSDSGPVREAAGILAGGVEFEDIFVLIKSARKAFFDLLEKTGLSLPERAGLMESLIEFFDGLELALLRGLRDFSSGASLSGLQEALRSANDEKYRYQALFRSMAEPAFVVDREMMILDVNQALQDKGGLTRDEVIGRSCRDIFSCRSCRNCPLEEAMRVGGLFSGRQTDLAFKDVEQKVILSGSSLKDAAGEVFGGVMVIQDVSEIVRSEEALRESEARLRTLFEYSGAGIGLFDAEGRFLEANPFLCRLLGYSPEELAQMTLLEVTHPEDIDLSLKNMKEIVSGQAGVANFEKRYLHRDGRVIQALVSSTAWQGFESGPDRFISHIQDITPLKEAEKEKARMETQLRQAQKMEAVGTLAGGIAHDFNNILGAMIGYTELTLIDQTLDLQARSNLSQVLNAAKRAKDLVKQILAFSRRTEQHFSPVGIRPLIKETIKFLRSSLPTTIEIRQNLAVSNDTVMADPTQIQQILMNLCTNAAHAMEESGGELKISLSEAPDPKAQGDDLPPSLSSTYLRLTVEDTGQGMDQTVLERVFEPYFTTKKPGEGTGMGLSLVHGLVKSHGGEIRVESQVGRGSVFHVFLPQVPRSDLTAQPESVELKTGREKILFVDDEEPLVELAEGLLKRLGYQAVCLTSSSEALRLFQEDPDRFDLVITDQTMPKPTGIELAREITGNRPEMPIILCSGFSHGISPETARQAGVRRFLMKPLVIQDMASVIREVLDAQD